jgi:redox-sensitive bicupin YhaK (pirin superfamily)
MITLRPAAERGHFDFGWLRTWHTFSFGEYHDEAWMGFRALRVINEDFIAPGRGFGKHGHRDMEIVTVPLTGGVAHEDSSGGKGVIRPGVVQRMSAGTGILHSEHNASQNEETHLLQIWLLPTERGIAPGYEEQRLDPTALRNRLALIAAPDGREGALTIRSAAELRMAQLEPGARVAHDLADGRHAWVQIARGALTLEAAAGDDRGSDRAALTAGDGAAVSAAHRLQLTAGPEGAELLLFDLA